MSKVAWAPFLFVISAVLSSCGGGTSVLQSVSINQQSATQITKFTATGTFSDGRQITPISVSWIQWSYASFVAGQPQYRLTSSPFSAQCMAAGSAWSVVAIAPADPHAPDSGVIPMNVFQDLVSGETTGEGGFIAATVQLTCP